MATYTYRVFCVDEDEDVYSTTGSPVAPTTCPNNVAHVIDQNLTVLESSTVPTGGGGTNVDLLSDNLTNSVVYPVWSATSTATPLIQLNSSNTKLSFIPLSGELKSTYMGATDSIRLYDTPSTSYVALKMTGTMPSSYTLTLPTAVGSTGQVLRTSNGSGSLEWFTPTSGTVTSIVAGTGMNFTTITSTGTITLANTAVTPATYTGSFTVDQQGRLTAATNILTTSGDLQYHNGTIVTRFPIGTNNQILTSNGSVPVWSSSITASAVSLSGTSGTVTLNTTGTVTSYSLTLPTAVGSTGQVLRTSNGTGTLEWFTPTTGTVTSITAGTGLSGGTIIGSGTISLANTAVTAAAYTGGSSFTVDSQGRLTAAANVLTTSGDLLYHNGTVVTRFPVGTNNQILTSNGSVPVWSDNLTVPGNLVVNGTLSTLNSATIAIGDNMISLNKNNTIADITDAGFYTTYFNGSAVRYAGLFRDASTGQFEFFKDEATEPDSTLPTWTRATVAMDKLVLNNGDGTNLSLYFAGDTTTGMNRISTGILGFQASGAVRFRIAPGVSSFLFNGTPVMSVSEPYVDMLTLLRIFSPDQLTYFGLAVPNSGTSYTLTFPSAVGSSGQALRTSNGTGSLQWFTPGTVTSITAGTGLSGGPITGSGTLSLANTTVTAAAYTAGASFTVDAQGRLTAAANTLTTTGDILYHNGTIVTRFPVGSTNQMLTVTAGLPAWISGTRLAGTSGVLTLTCTGTVTSYTLNYPTAAGTAGQVLRCNASVPANLEWFTPTVGTVTSITAGTGMNFTTITSTGTIALANTAVTPATYTGSFTVDQQGRLTAATNILTTGGDILYHNGTIVTRFPVGTNNQILTSNGSLPVWSSSITVSALNLSGTSGTVTLNTTGTVTSYTLTFPTAVGSTGQALRAFNGTGTLEWYTPTTGTVTSITAGTGMNFTTITSTGTINLANTAVTPATYTGSFTVDQQGRLTAATNILTTTGDILYHNGTTVARFPVGSTNQMLTVTSGLPAWISGARLAGTSGFLTLTCTGTVTSYTLNFPTAAGTAGQVLRCNAVTPANLEWFTPTSGTVTSIMAGTGLSGGTITGSGTIDLANTAVTAASYQAGASFTVDAQGRLTAAANTLINFGDILYFNGTTATRLPIGSANQMLCSISNLPTWISGTRLAGTSGHLALTCTGTVTTYALNFPIALGSTGQALRVASGFGDLEWYTPTTGTVTSIVAGTGMSFTTITSTGTIALANTAVTPATYTGSFTVDQQGRLTAATNILTTTGDILYHNGTIVTRFPVGSTNQMLTVTSGLPAWISGTRLAGTSGFLTLTCTGTVTSYTLNFPTAAGTAGQVLRCNASVPANLEWFTPSTGSVTSITAGIGLSGGTITGSGTIDLANTAVTPAGYTGGASFTVDAQGRLTAAANTLTTSGDILYHNGTIVTRFPVGTNNQILTSNGSVPVWSSSVTVSGVSLTGTSGTVTLNTTGTVTSYTLTLPTAVGSTGQALRAFNGTGTLEWYTPTTGTVTSITAGTGLSGGTITGSGTISLANTAVTLGAYTGGSSFTVDAQGRLTAATNILTTSGDLLHHNGTTVARFPVGTANQVLTSSGSLPVWSSSVTVSGVSLTGTSGTVTLNTTGTVTSYTLTLPTAVGSTGQALRAFNGTGTLEWYTPTTGTVTSITAGTGMNFTTITSTGTIALANTAVTPATYTGSFTVDQQGRLTAATNILTTTGDLLYHNGTIVTRFPVGSTNQMLTVTSGLPAWISGTRLAGTSGFLTLTCTGTVTSYTLNYPTAAGTAGQVLRCNASTPANLEWFTPTVGTVTSITAGTGMNFATITSTGTITLADTAVTPGTFTGSFTVDQQGRLTAATNILTTSGDLLHHNGTTVARFAVGGNGSVLQSTGSLPVWNTSLNQSGNYVSVLSTNTSTDTADGGFYITYAAAGPVTRYAGLFRDASNSGRFELFTGHTSAPGATMTGWTSGNLALGKLTCESSGAQTDTSLNFGTPGTGLYGTSTAVNFSAAGTQRLSVYNSYTQSFQPFITTNGSAFGPSYSFTSDTFSGMYLISSSNLGFSAGNGLRLTINTTGILLPASHSLQFSGSSGTASLAVPNSAITTYTLTLPTAVGSTGQALRASNGTGTLEWYTPTTGTVTSIAAGTGMNFTTITSTGTISLADTAVAPGTYTGSFTVDQQGRLTSATNILTTSGDLLYHNGSIVTRFPVGASNRVLTSSGSLPVWSSSITVSGVSLSGTSGTVTLNTTGTVTSYTLTFPTAVGSTGQALRAANGTGTLEWYTPAGGGTVTSITAGTGLSGGTITTSGTIDLANTAVSPAAYTGGSSFTVDAQGRLTAAANTLTTTGDMLYHNGTTVTRFPVGSTNQMLCVLAGLPAWISSTRLAGTTGFLELTCTGTVTSYNLNYPTAAGTAGQVLRCNATTPANLEWFTPTVGTVTSIATGTGLTGGPITGGGTISLANTAVTIGTYNAPSITVDQQGRLTAATNILTTTGDLLYNNGATVTRFPVGSTNQMLTVTAGLPAWMSGVRLAGTSGFLTLTCTGTVTPYTLNYPTAAGTAGQVLRCNATTPANLEWFTPTVGTVTSITAGTGMNFTTITSTGTITLANTAVTIGTYNAPSITVDQQGRLTFAANILTTSGDLFHHNGTTAARFAVGGNGAVLQSTGSLPVWNTSMNQSGGYVSVLSTNTATDTVDGGFYITYGSTGAKYAGLFRDASNAGRFELFTGHASVPGSAMAGWTSGELALSRIYAADGSSALPSITFTNDPDCGLARYGANDIGIASGGDVMLKLFRNTATTGDIIAYRDFYIRPDATNNRYIFTDTLATFSRGLVSQSAGNGGAGVEIRTTGGVRRHWIDTTDNVLTNSVASNQDDGRLSIYQYDNLGSLMTNIQFTRDGTIRLPTQLTGGYTNNTAARPAYTFQGDTGSGMFGRVAGELNFSTSGTEAMRLTANRQLELPLSHNTSISANAGVQSGTHVCTITSLSNCSSVNMTLYYTKVGKVIHATGRGDIGAFTTANVNSTFRFSLPLTAAATNIVAGSGIAVDTTYNTYFSVFVYDTGVATTGLVYIKPSILTQVFVNITFCYYIA